jgi:hypothetical protein
MLDRMAESLKDWKREVKNTFEWQSLLLMVVIFMC